MIREGCRYECGSLFLYKLPLLTCILTEIIAIVALSFFGESMKRKNQLDNWTTVADIRFRIKIRARIIKLIDSLWRVQTSIPVFTMAFRHNAFNSGLILASWSQRNSSDATMSLILNRFLHLPRQLMVYAPQCLDFSGNSCGPDPLQLRARE